MKRWLSTGVWCFSHILLVACGASGGLEATEAEFRVTYTSPEESQVILERRPQLYVVFSRLLDASTVSTDTVSLQSEFGEDVRGSVSVGNLTPTMISFEPNDKLSTGTTYILRIRASSVRDRIGGTLASPFEVRFAVEGEKPTAPPPGGVNTPGGSPVEDEGVIYGGDGGVNFELDPDGDWTPVGFTGGSHGGRSRASPRLHGGDRVWLAVRGAGKWSGGPGQAILAVIPARGEEILVYTDAAAAFNHPRWGLDESFVSCRVLYPDNTTSYLKFAVTWDASGSPSFGQPVVVASANTLGATKINGYDWAPNGQDFVYLHDTGTVNQLRVMVSGQVSILDGRYSNWPSWSPAGDRIAYSVGGRVVVVNTDGTGMVDLGAGGGGLFSMFSPSGAELVFIGPVATGRLVQIANLSDGTVRTWNAGGPLITGLQGWSSTQEAR